MLYEMKSAQPQEFTLHWTDLSNCLAASFQELRETHQLIDVTIACEGQNFGAHKVVLAACSPFLREILKTNPCKHPIIIVQDIIASDMSSLLEYMYRGMVRVIQEQLPSFIRSAEVLQLRGLAMDRESSEVIPLPPEEDVTREASELRIPCKRNINNTQMKPRKKKKITKKGIMMSGLKDVKSGETLTADSLDLICADAIKGTTECLEANNDSCQLTDELDPQGKRRNASDRPTNCPLCGSIIRQARNLRRHLELMHFNGGKAHVKVRVKSKDGTNGKKTSSTHSSMSSTPASTPDNPTGPLTPTTPVPTPSPEQTTTGIFNPYSKTIQDYAKSVQEIQLNPYSVMISNQMAAQAYFSHIQPPAFPNDANRRTDVMQENLSVPPIPCPECGLLLNHPRVIEHLQSSHPQSVYIHRTCLDCRQIFDSAEQLQEHREQVHREPFHHHREQIAPPSRDRHGNPDTDRSTNCNPIPMT